MGNLRAVLVAFLVSAIALQMCSVDASLSDSCYYYWGADRGGFTGQDSAALKLNKAGGQPYTIHTNIFTQGVGQREQQFKPWSNPSDGYHNYTMQWTPYAIVWLIDSVPIRVFHNFHNSEINWSLASFEAGLKNYKPSACYCPDTNSVWKCARNLTSCTDTSSTKEAEGY